MSSSGVDCVNFQYGSKHGPLHLCSFSHRMLADSTALHRSLSQYLAKKGVWRERIISVFQTPLSIGSHSKTWPFQRNFECSRIPPLFDFTRPLILGPLHLCSFSHRMLADSTALHRSLSQYLAKKGVWRERIKDVGGWVLTRMDRPCRKLFRSPFLLLFLCVYKASPSSTFFVFLPAEVPPNLPLGPTSVQAVDGVWVWPLFQFGEIGYGIVEAWWVCRLDAGRRV